jgi:hypothetical protein
MPLVCPCALVCPCVSLPAGSDATGTSRRWLRRHILCKIVPVELHLVPFYKNVADVSTHVRYRTHGAIFVFRTHMRGKPHQPHQFDSVR